MRKNKKRIVCALLAAALLCGSLFAVPAAAEESADSTPAAAAAAAEQAGGAGQADGQILSANAQNPVEQQENAGEQTTVDQTADQGTEQQTAGESSEQQSSGEQQPAGSGAEGQQQTPAQPQNPAGQQTAGETPAANAGQAASNADSAAPQDPAAATKESAAENPAAGAGQSGGTPDAAPATTESAAQGAATAETATAESATAETATAETATAESATAETAAAETATAETAEPDLSQLPRLNAQPFADAALNWASFSLRLFARGAQNTQLALTKTVSEISRTADERGIFKLELSAAAPSDFVNEKAPRDIVLVLDVSGSMSTPCYDPAPISTAPDQAKSYVVLIEGEPYQVDYGVYRTGRGTRTGWYIAGSGMSGDYGVSWSGAGRGGYDFYPFTATRLQAMQTAVKGYLAAVANNSPQSRVNIIAFSGSSGSITGGFVPVGASVNPTLTTAVEALSAGGATNSGAALQSACNAFGALSDRQSPVCILFTDGQPYLNTGRNSPDFNETVANNAVAAAETLKTTYQAAVYTVGVFSGLNDPDKIYSYMHHVSSNFINCTDYKSGDCTVENSAVNQPHDYFRTADSAAGLADIFAELAVQKGTGLKGALVRDVLAAGFAPCAPDGTFLTQNTVLGADGLPLEQSAQKTPSAVLQKNSEGLWVLEWSGIDLLPPTIQGGAAVNFAASLYCRPTADNPGGNSLATNGAGSGVYASVAEGAPLQAFESPKVNVPISLADVVLEKTVFLGETLTQSGMAEELRGRINAASPYPLSGDWNVETQAGVAASDTAFAPAQDAEYQFRFTLTPPAAPDAGVGKPCTSVSAAGMVIVRVVKGQITLAKTVTNGEAKQSYLFKIEGPDGTFYEVLQDISGSGRAQKTLVGLRRGSYRITELTDWSWQYSLSGAPLVVNAGLTESSMAAQPQDGSALVQVGQPTGAGGQTPEQNYTATTACTASVTFANTKNAQTVLSDTTWVVNEFACN